MNELLQAAKAVIAEWDEQLVVGDRKLRAAVERAGWQPIETHPIGEAILVHYKTSYGKSRIIKARYVAKHTEEAAGYDCDDYEKTEYCEENDTYYLLEGWLELIDNWDDYSSVYFDQPLTHWMLLPEPPND